MVSGERFLLLPVLLVLTAVLGTSGFGYTVLEGVGMYKVGPAVVASWNLAFDACSKDGPYAHLAVVNTEKEAAALKALVANYSFDFYYVGFTDFFGKRDFSTVQGTSLNELGYSLWYNNAPIELPSAMCGTVTRFIELSNQNCTLNYSYICEMPPWTNYDYVHGVGYYKFYTDGKTWKDAADTCKADGAELLVVDSEEEYDVVARLLEEHPYLPNTDSSAYIHYGVHDYYIDLRPVTVAGIPLVVNQTGDPVIWGASEPKASPTNNVVALNRAGQMFMSAPTLGYAFICEHQV